MVSEQMEESLRREIESYVDRRLSSLKQEIAQLQSQLDEAFKRLLEDEGEGHWDGSLAATVTEHLRAAHERGVELAAAESSRAQAASDMAIVKSAIEEIQGHHSQGEILKSLVNRGSSFAPRLAFFVIKGDQARGWRARGFQGTVGDDAIQDITFPVLADTVISEVVRSRTTWSGTPNSQSENDLLLSRLGEQAPQRIVAVPLVVRSKAVAVLYADSAELDSDAINLEALETLVRVASMAVELFSAARPAAPKPQVEPAPAPTPPVMHEAPAAPEPEAAAPETTAPPPDIMAPPQAISPGAVAPETMAPSKAVAPEPAPYTPVREYDEPAVENLGQPAPTEHFVEPVPVVEPGAVTEVESEAQAPAYESEATAPLTGRRRYGSYDAELPVSVSDDEERRAHNDARRFARLLVSEIKLYNEQKVAEGRSQGDLYSRLREYIDRSREMYDKRVRPGVAVKYDYFHHELVTTLAEGDASKLGEAYPGTTVSA